ncbi:cytochrome c [Roseovarius sp. TE539]|uniref:c-type cytochrome n=1 Tax=Roseovarius sp. TE539 TaxID=2249812 RepID=UPI00215C14E3|nr:cytochrome c [Roseovarius sp. TE539]
MKTILLAAACAAMALGTWGAAQDLRAGQETYTRYCAACHGGNAQGNGPMVAVLLVQPTDLSALSARNDGVFPLDRVVKRIDGRDPLVSHGSEMPVYGNFFEGREVELKTDDGRRVLASQAVADLVAYLKSMQAHEETGE